MTEKTDFIAVNMESEQRVCLIFLSWQTFARCSLIRLVIGTSMLKEQASTSRGIFADLTE